MELVLMVARSLFTYVSLKDIVTTESVAYSTFAELPHLWHAAVVLPN